jgi:hypothetical protein
MTKQETRPFDPQVLKAQLGMFNIFAISGGRFYIDGATFQDGKTQQVELPVAYGYRVRIFLDWNDTYTVQRVIVKNTKNGIKETIKGSVEGVYCDQVGQVAYYASCYQSHPEFGQSVEQVQ